MTTTITQADINDARRMIFDFINMMVESERMKVWRLQYKQVPDADSDTQLPCYQLLWTCNAVEPYPDLVQGIELFVGSSIDIVRDAFEPTNVFSFEDDVFNTRDLFEYVANHYDA